MTKGSGHCQSLRLCRHEVSTGSGSDRVSNTDDFAEGRREIEIQSITAQRADFRNDRARSIPQLSLRVLTRRSIGDYEHSQS